jgi:isoquinoline 1-oxidoreductase beta subunit
MNQSRREFLISAAAIGGSFVLGVSRSNDASAAITAAVPRPWEAPPADSSEFNPWITIGKDSVVTVRVPTPEIGNGVMTQVLMTVTEELNCDWSHVRAEYASPTRNYLEGNVYSKPGGYLAFFGGRSTSPERTAALLQAGCSARERLKEAAAQAWGVPRNEIEAKNSLLTHARSGRKATYGEMAEKAGAAKLESEPTPKPAQEWWFLGKASPAKVHLPHVANGTAVYGIDVKVPDMVYAALMQSPVHGGKLKSYDFEKIRDMPGVKAVVVVDPSEPRAQMDPKLPPFPLGLSTPQSGVAVIADHYWQARKALEALPVEWDDGPGAQWKTNAQTVKAVVDALENEGKKIETSRGKPLEVLQTSSKVVEATYVTPFCDHATMEPLNGTALVTAERVDVWHPTQHGHQALFIAAQETGMPPEKVHIHPTFAGGGFGRRVFGDDLRMVVAIARKFPGRPVKVIWSREESMRQGRYRHLQAAKLRAALDDSGLPAALHVRTAGSPGNFMRYLHDGPHAVGAIEHTQVESTVVPMTILGGPYRGPGYNSHAFFVDTFIDECAAAAKMDPLQYRLKLYAKWPDPGWTKCLQEVAAKANWGRKLPKGWGQGVAIANWGIVDGKPETGTTVALIATVEVTRKGVLRIDSIDVAFDTGRVFNPDAVRAQIEGGVILGLNMALNEQLTVENGRIVEGNYHQYPMLRIGDVPKRIGVHYGGLTGHPRTTEIGEPPAGVIGPAVGNAIFRATGKRLRSMPFRLHDLRWA